MKKLSLLLTVFAGLAFVALATPSSAAEQGKGKEVTLKGEAKCAMCALHETEKCQTVIQTEGKNGKKVTYYLADNDVAKGFHENVCKAAKKVTVTGTVKKVNGKEQLTPSKIDLAKD
jgi:RecG-like helicase